MAKEKTRVQIEMPEASLERLKMLKEKTEATSYAEVTKNAYRLYEKMINFSESGTICFKDKDGNIKEIDLFI